MTIGNTTTDALADSLPKLIAQARIIREHEGVVPQLVDKVTLAEGTGNIWHEVSLAQLTAQTVTETTVLDNPQQIADTDFPIEPTSAGIMTLITDRVAKRISKNVFAKIGALAQNAIQRKKDEDGLTLFASGVEDCDPGVDTTLTSGHIMAALSNIQGNATEPGKPPYRIVLHPYQIKDIADELLAGLGTYPIDEGLTARVVAEGFMGLISTGQVYADGNISLSGDDATGAVFPQEAIVLVQGRSPRAVAVRKEEIGAGATAIYHYDEYAYGERSDGNWLYEMTSDATAPTS